MLIDETYFVGRLSIPNTSKDYVLERLTSLIETLEPQLLEDILGYPLYKVFIAGTEDFNPESSNSTIEDRFMEIIEGAEYTDCNDKLRKFKGLLFEDGTTPRSPIANYVYYHWLKDNATQTTGVGEATAEAELADVASPAVKMVEAWNEMSKWISDLLAFLYDKKETYPEWSDEDRYCTLQKFRSINTFNI